ncbi:MAG: hypothetical protein QM808_15080 [Steroidobacteraceae bacterium]
MSKSSGHSSGRSADKAAELKLGLAKAKSPGMTWWGQRWIEALERSSRDVVARLGKGRAYARDGHVHGLKIVPGKISAVVSDDELDSFNVTLSLEAFDAKTWQQIMLAMSQQALFAAQLLNGEMPRDIDRLFRSCGKSLFPANSHDIDADCGCDDWSSPCKHVAATHYVLGEALDRDPFLLFELRGRSKEQVLAGLNQLRAHGGADVTTAPAMPEPAATTAQAVPLSSLSMHNFERGNEALPALSFNFDSNSTPGALLRSLGKPASWSGHEAPQDLFGPALQLARQLACELATGSGALPGLRNQSAKATAKTTRVRKARGRAAPSSSEQSD